MDKKTTKKFDKTAQRISNPKIAIMGLGYIGLPLLAAFASRGLKVVGVDINPEKIRTLKRSYRTDIYEPGLNETLDHFRKNIEFTDDERKALLECEVVLITVGTPVKMDGRPDFHYLDDAVSSIGKHLRAGQLIIFKSTIMPGITRKLAARLEKISKLKAGNDFYVVFCPERTVEGKALQELYTLPKIIGGINPKSLEEGVKIIKRLGGEVIRVSSLEAAEICKCIDNTYRVNQIAFANEIGEICEKAGLNSYEIVGAVNSAYARTDLFWPGLGAGGPCLSKDPQILSYFARKNKVEPRVITASIIKNQESIEKITKVAAGFLKKHGIKNPKIAIAGLAFKGHPETDDIRNAPSVDFHNILRGKISDAAFNFYDPIVKNFLGHKTASSLSACLKDANLAVFLTNHAKLKNIEADLILKNASRPLLIIDCWQNVANLQKIEGGRIEVLRIGDNNFRYSN